MVNEDPRGTHRAGPDEPVDPHDRQDVDADEVVGDAVEYFVAGGDDDSPAADTDAPVPPG